MIPVYFDYLERTSRNHGVPVLSRTRVLEIAGTYAKPAEAYAPDLVEEAGGIADGADVPIEEIMALNGFLDIFDYLSPNFIGAGCTTFMVPDMEGGARAAIGQNYDLVEIFQPAAVLLQITGAGPDALMYTTAGMLESAGLNSEGIGVVINNLVPGDAGPGVPYPFVIRRILAAAQIGDAIDAAVLLSPGVRHELCSVRRHGEIYNLETTAADYEATSPFDGPMAHSNHYLADRLIPLERRANDQRGQSLARWGRATRLLNRSADPDAETIKSALGDHVNSPFQSAGTAWTVAGRRFAALFWSRQMVELVRPGGPAANTIGWSTVCLRSRAVVSPDGSRHQPQFLNLRLNHDSRPTT